MTKREIIEQISKPAVIFEVGGFRPDENVMSSWIGKIMVALKGEGWPLSNGQPMLPLCQINIAELPHRPESLKDISLITLFFDSSEIPSDNEPNGVKWCLRTYKHLDDLIKLEQPEIIFPIKPFQLKPKLVTHDFPCYEDIPIELPNEFAEDYHDVFENMGGIKIGGWPTLIQGELSWAPFNENSASPEYVFQIDSIEKAHWQWGDGGVGYFGRNTNGEANEWFFSWQCY